MATAAGMTTSLEDDTAHALTGGVQTAEPGTEIAEKRAGEAEQQQQVRVPCYKCDINWKQMCFERNAFLHQTSP